MAYLKCTSAIQKALGIRKDQIGQAQPVDAPLGSWYVHLFPAAGTKFCLFMSEVTLLSFVLHQGKKRLSCETLPMMFMAGLHQLLTMKGVDPLHIARILQEYPPGLYAKTDSKKLLGSMNDLIWRYSMEVEDGGGLDYCDLTKIIMDMNDMPQRSLGWQTSWPVTLEAIAARNA